MTSDDILALRRDALSILARKRLGIEIEAVVAHQALEEAGTIAAALFELSRSHPAAGRAIAASPARPPARAQAPFGVLAASPDTLRTATESRRVAAGAEVHHVGWLTRLMRALRSLLMVWKRTGRS